MSWESWVVVGWLALYLLTSLLRLVPRGPMPPTAPSRAPGSVAVENAVARYVADPAVTAAELEAELDRLYGLPRDSRWIDWCDVAPVR